MALVKVNFIQEDPRAFDIARIAQEEGLPLPFARAFSAQ